MPSEAQSNPPDGPRPVDPVGDEKLRKSVEAALGPEVGTKETRARVVERVIRSVSEYYSGPLPHPRHLKAFEDACPGAGARILAMAEQAQSRQEDRLDKAMDYEYQDRRLGLHLGFYALIAVLIAGVIITAMGNVALGASLLGAAVLGAAIGPFIHGRHSQEESPKRAPTHTQNPALSSTPANPQLPSPEKPSFLTRILSMLGIR
ncbi:MAG TPA: DUF2335 domain-containing protein [Xanthobacteraceae bacterium]|jgi:uncharacterized membrane protein